jgi:hypothetical protein
MKYIDYKIGDSIYYFGPKHKEGGKILFKGSGFITEDYISERECYTKNYVIVKNREYCKTTFSYKSGSGTKRFNKRKLITCRILLSEKLIYQFPYLSIS